MGKILNLGLGILVAYGGFKYLNYIDNQPKDTVINVSDIARKTKGVRDGLSSKVGSFLESEETQEQEQEQPQIKKRHYSQDSTRFHRLNHSGF